VRRVRVRECEREYEKNERDFSVIILFSPFRILLVLVVLSECTDMSVCMICLKL